MASMAPCGSDTAVGARFRATDRSALLPLWIFIAFSALYVGLTRGHFLSTDEIGVYQATRSLWERGDLAVESPEGAPGRGGRRFTVVNSGQSIAALPLFAAGKAFGATLERLGRTDWVRTFAGAVLERPGGDRWGGEIGIFFVNLFNCFATALLCAVFFAFSICLGAGVRSALAATALLGLTSYVAALSSGFFQHSSEALLLLWAFYFLFSDARIPDWRSRVWAGVLTALLLQFRYPAVVAVPGLLLYHLAVVWRRQPWERASVQRLRALARGALPFVGLLVAGFALHAVDQFAKFGTIFLTGQYASVRFDSPLLIGVFAYLLSPGDSIFLFTPVLLIAPFALSRFAPRFRLETAFVLFQAGFYLFVYSKDENWHGLWCFGPRYLAATVPLLLLPLAPWLESRGRKAWWAIVPLALVGLWMQLIHVAVSFWAVARHEGYLEFKPPLGFLFDLKRAPVVAHTHALLAGDYRVDMWLVDVYRTSGGGRVAAVLVPLVAVLLCALWRLGASVRGWKASPSASDEQRFGLPRSLTFAILVGLVVVPGLVLLYHQRDAGGSSPAATRLASTTQDIDALMAAGNATLDGGQNPLAGASIFAKVLALEGNHYRATLQLARALDAAGRPSDARLMWRRALAMAQSRGDGEIEETARERLARQP